MRRFLVLSILAMAATSAAAQPSDDEIKKAYTTCKEHRVIQWDKMHPKFIPPRDFRLKNWQEGWEFCSQVQDAFEVIEKREVDARINAEKDAINNLAKQLPK